MQTNHRISTNLQRRIYGHATNVEIRPLNEEKAVQAAADLIGELFVFSVRPKTLINLAFLILHLRTSCL
jgi:optic atrophy 3 protein